MDKCASILAGRFDTWVEFKRALCAHSLATGRAFKIRSSTTVESRNRKEGVMTYDTTCGAHYTITYMCADKNAAMCPAKIVATLKRFMEPDGTYAFKVVADTKCVTHDHSAIEKCDPGPDDTHAKEIVSALETLSALVAESQAETKAVDAISMTTIELDDMVSRAYERNTIALSALKAIALSALKIATLPIAVVGNKRRRDDN